MANLFESLGLNSALVEALKKEGISEPTEIQMKSIPLALENKDIIGQSETGSGKTLAFLLPIFQKIDPSKRETQAIILAPTHELVVQIDKQIKLLSQNSNLNITSTTIIGEVNVKRQIDKLKEKPHIIVGSSGRVLELIKKKKISAHTIKTIVIDECDRLLDQNNITSVKEIIKSTMRDRQLMIFSATITEKTLDIAKDLVKDAEIIKAKETLVVNPNINHLYFLTEQRDKIELLRKLLASTNPKRAIVFINETDNIQMTTLKLQYHHINAQSIHGSSSKEERQKTLEDFRKGKTQVLVSSDLAARGLDIKGLTHIFNLDLPENPKDYLHRTGRTGRAGNSGVAISLVTKVELSKITRYKKDFNIKIDEKTIYKGRIMDLNEKKELSPRPLTKKFKKNK